MSEPRWDRLLLNATLATFVGDVPYGLIEHGAIALHNGRIAWIGGMDALPDAPDALAGVVESLDGALVTPAYTWSGLMAALLANGEPVGTIAAALFFAALQTGGFAMQRETSVPRVLTLVLQAIVILFLAMRRGLGRRM